MPPIAHIAPGIFPVSDDSVGHSFMMSSTTAPISSTNNGNGRLPALKRGTNINKKATPTARAVTLSDSLCVSADRALFCIYFFYSTLRLIGMNSSGNPPPSPLVAS